MKIIRLDECDSTNNYLKRAGLSGDVCVVSALQTGGRGTKGRSFVSERGGLYVSFQREYTNFPAQEAFKIMVNASVAVCAALQSFGIEPVIRWPNDVLAGGLKICGTLIENTLSCGHISRSIVGIGINVSNELPPDLCGIATTMRAQLGRTVRPDEVLKVLIDNMQCSYSVGKYKSYINWLGKPVRLFYGGTCKEVVAVDISDGGGLVCRLGDDIFTVNAAEVSLRVQIT